ncbi:MAG: hypothetical protein RIR50_439, partial [Pseudomonadota bacterium]
CSHIVILQVEGSRMSEDGPPRMVAW